MSVKPKRQFAKAITWQLVASVTTFLIGWIVTGDVHFGMTIGVFDLLIKIVLYYFHEHIWYQSNIGIVYSEQNPEHKTLFINALSNK